MAGAAVPAGSSALRSEPCDALLLDIGGSVGALVVYSNRQRVGEEIQLDPIGGVSRRTHNIVRERTVGGGVVYAAVFPALEAGSYSIVPRLGSGQASRRPADVRIAGGQVTEANWGDGFPEENSRR